MKDTVSITTNNKKNKRYLNWSDITRECCKIAALIENEKKKVDFIYGIPRGGMIPAVIISHMINKPIIDTDSLHRIPKTMCVLVIDDIIDSGATTIGVKTQMPNSILVSLYLNKISTVTPDFYGEKTLPDTWIVFPWEEDEGRPPSAEFVPMKTVRCPNGHVMEVEADETFCRCHCGEAWRENNDTE